MSVKLTLALTSPFRAEKEVSWAASRLSVCLLGQECPSLAHPLFLTASLSSAPWQHPHPKLPDTPPPPTPALATCNWHLLFLDTGYSEVRGWESQILSKQRCLLPQQEKKKTKKTWTGQGTFPFQGAGYWEVSKLLAGVPGVW